VGERRILNVSKFAARNLGRRGFVASALVAAAALPAAAGPWPRDKDPKGCDDYLPTLDLDAPWHHADATQDNNAGCAAGTNLSIPETQNTASRFASALVTNDAVRGAYYKLIRTYKKGRASGTDGGSYGKQYLTIVQQFAPSGKRVALNDLANIHLTTFLILRRAVLALTAHDIDPDSFDPKEDGQPLHGEALVHFFSYHYGPNAGSSVTYSPSNLVDPYQP
jgi:hypothetical protein